MADIDNALNRYFGNEECADFINTVGFNGKRVVKPEDIIEKDPVMARMYEENGKTTGMKRERDLFRMVRVNNTYYIFIGIEHQSWEDPIMPLRVAEYDILAYRNQYDQWEKERDENIKKGKKTSHFKLKPVMTYVIYWSDKEWTKPKSLKELMDEDIIKNLEGTPFADMILDYKMTVYSPADRDKFEGFETNLGKIFTFIRYQKYYKLLTEYFEKEQSSLRQDELDVINMVTGSDFKVKEGEVGLSMCDALRDLKEAGRMEGRNEGREEGRMEGRAEGREEGRAEELLLSVKKLIKNLHMTPDQAMDTMQVPQEQRDLFMKSLV